MAFNPFKMTRPRRRVLVGGCLAILWAIHFTILWLPHEYTWSWTGQYKTSTGTPTETTTGSREMTVTTGEIRLGQTDQLKTSARGTSVAAGTVEISGTIEISAISTTGKSRLPGGPWTLPAIGSGVAGIAGTYTQSFGLLDYMILKEQNVTFSRKPQVGFSRTFRWQGWRLAITLVISLVITVACLLGYRWSMGRYRLVSACDECGYNLTGLTSGTCPECGTAIRS